MCPGNGLKSIRGSWGDHLGSISGVLDPLRGLQRAQKPKTRPIRGNILTFPNPPCQPGQFFLVQNGLYRCLTCSTTCFMLNSYLWGVFLALWSQIVKLFHKIYILSNEGFPKTLDVDNVILKMTNYIPHRLKESLSPNRNISFSGQISLKI